MKTKIFTVLLIGLFFFNTNLFSNNFSLTTKEIILIGRKGPSVERPKSTKKYLSLNSGYKNTFASIKNLHMQYM